MKPSKIPTTLIILGRHVQQLNPDLVAVCGAGEWEGKSVLFVYDKRAAGGREIMGLRVLFVVGENPEHRIYTVGECKIRPPGGEVFFPALRGYPHPSGVSTDFKVHDDQSVHAPRQSEVEGVGEYVVKRYHALHWRQPS
jgi:hypothetical protein